MKPSFDHTVSILVKAYLNDTLIHGTCSACAVGNMIAHEMGIAISKEDGWWSPHAYPCWDNVFYTGDHPDAEDAQIINLSAYHGDAKKQIDSTGYSVFELALIEKTFESHNPLYFIGYESAKHPKTRDEWMFSGLMAVIDVLADIHNIDLTQKETAKALFVK